MKTVSLGVAMRLSKAGYSLDHCTHCYVMINGDWTLVTIEDGKQWTGIRELFPAPCPSEFYNLPVGFTISRKSQKTWLSWYHDFNYPDTFKHEWESKKQVDSIGLGWEYCAQNNLLGKTAQSNPFAFLAKIKANEWAGLHQFARDEMSFNLLDMVESVRYM